MSDPENFLSRWSRRKREALQAFTSPRLPSGRLRPSQTGVSALMASGEREQAAVPNATIPPTRGDEEAPARPEPAPTTLALDPASLPPIDTITAETDIRGFLASGVPLELTRAALRHAWACDPKIRDFVGLAEYDWDFNAAGSMAGFGPLQVTDDIGKMAASIVKPDPSETGVCNFLDPTSTPTIPRANRIANKIDTQTSGGAVEVRDQGKRCDQPTNEIGVTPRPADPRQGRHPPVAAQYTDTKSGRRNTSAKRQHGGALPK
jgi:hypothetical protein